MIHNSCIFVSNSSNDPLDWTVAIIRRVQGTDVHILDDTAKPDVYVTNKRGISQNGSLTDSAEMAPEFERTR